MTNIEITKLQLCNFRNYKSKTLNFSKKINVLLGRNGAGKTNILESISLLKKGSGLKKADICDMICSSSDIKNTFSIYAEINNHPEIDEIGTSYQEEKRIFQINGKKISSYTNEIPIIHLIPQMDDLFSDNKSNRRSFLDKITSNIYPSHKSNLNNYAKYLKERVSLLEKYLFAKKDPDQYSSWIDIVEKKISEIGIIIAANRNDMIDHLNKAILMSKSGFTKSKLHIIGDVEEFAMKNTAIITENFFQNKLKENRRKDFERQRVAFGVHRSDFSAILNDNMEAKSCSTGEQKSILIAIIFAVIRIFQVKNLEAPILLLDEITSHLDDKKRRDLYDEIFSLNVQTFLTGTERYLFSDFTEDNVEFINITSS
ncbi:MAG: DNA replication and repair protein RecF [Rickettsiales bacterium]